MLDLPGIAVLDKASLIGGCLKLPLQVDADRLAGEVALLPQSLWDGTGGRVGVHRVASSVFLRGYAPAEGERPIEERQPLAQLPYVRWIIETLIPAPAQRCLLARLPGGASITAHIDRAPYFGKTLRMHVPVTTHEQAWMMAAGQTYRMRPGEVWLLNNSAMHAVHNADPARERTHLICDFTLTPGLAALIERGDRNCAVG